MSHTYADSSIRESFNVQDHCSITKIRVIARFYTEGRRMPEIPKFYFDFTQHGMRVAGVAERRSGTEQMVRSQYFPVEYIYRPKICW